MDTVKQLLRYSLPGGVFAALLTLFDFLFRWAWRAKPSAVFSILTHDGITTAIGVVIFGFIIYQFYDAMHQPIVRFPWPRIKFGRTYDRAGWILSGLVDTDDKGVLDRIRKTQGIQGRIGFVERHDMDDSEYTHRWYRNAHALRSLISATATSTESRIRDDYYALSDIYHALGACRIATAFSAAAAIVHVGIYYPSYGNHLYRSMVATLLCVFVGSLWLRVVQHNRVDTLHTMRRQLRRDLRVWLARNPNYLADDYNIIQAVNQELEGAFPHPTSPVGNGGTDS